MSNYHALAYTIQPSQPFTERKTLKSLLDWHANALHVFEPLQYQGSLHLDSSTKLTAAEQVLRAAHVRYAWVTDRCGNRVGLIAVQDLTSGKAIQLAHDLRVTHDEIEVSELFTPLAQLPAVEFKHLNQATIGDVDVTLQKANANFLLIHNDDELMGVIPALKIAEVTGESVRLAPMANSFADLIHLMKPKTFIA
ncbi:MAG: hypothetical protein LAT77_08015 [Aliidiomarina sp.]|uniref:hypothetical protein n=1 Tax=Aliidiomarina sp. TaxID=1872439 RepID=UPI0025BCB4EE|nr:hypothetical protein [Aliidiomarina sp.]MCH8501840.1 hypothetical protein [Aliidiomarina sp.]